MSEGRSSEMPLSLAAGDQVGESESPEPRMDDFLFLSFLFFVYFMRFVGF